MTELNRIVDQYEDPKKAVEIVIAVLEAWLHEKSV